MIWLATLALFGPAPAYAGVTNNFVVCLKEGE